MPDTADIMPEKIRARFQNGMAPFLEEGEEVQLGVTMVPMPPAVYLLLALTIISPLFLLPYWIQKNCVIVLTDRNVYVIKTGFSSFKGKHVMFKAPRGNYSASYSSNALGPRLQVDEHKVWIPLAAKIKARGAAIAEAGSSAAPPPAVPA